MRGLVRTAENRDSQARRSRNRLGNVLAGGDAKFRVRLMSGRYEDEIIETVIAAAIRGFVLRPGRL